MLLRVLILIFAFNSIVPSAMAVDSVSGCQMDMEKSSMVMDSISMTDMANCAMHDIQQGCESVHCNDVSCMINSIPILSDTQMVFLPDVAALPQGKVAHFYKIVLPIQTPPPLV